MYVACNIYIAKIRQQFEKCVHIHLDFINPELLPYLA